MELDVGPFLERGKSEEELNWGQVMSLVWNKKEVQAELMSMVLKVWSPDKQHQHHLGTC